MDMVVARVRQATRADYRSIIALLEAEDQFDPHIWQCEEAYQRGESPSAGWQVAVVDRDGVSTVIGVAHADLAVDYGDLVTNRGFAPPHTQISGLVVDGDYRRHGVGRSLVQAVASAGARRGATFIVVVPDPEDDAGNDPPTFYQRCGLLPLEEHTDGEIPRHGAPIPAIAPVDITG